MEGKHSTKKLPKGWNSNNQPRGQKQKRERASYEKRNPVVPHTHSNVQRAEETL